MMALPRAALLLLLPELLRLAPAAESGSAAASLASDEALLGVEGLFDEDDECAFAQDGSDAEGQGGCALAAFQLRAHAAREALLQMERRDASPPGPPPDLDDDDDEGGDDEAEKGGGGGGGDDKGGKKEDDAGNDTNSTPSIVEPFEQCGGDGYQGPSDCGTEAECILMEKYYAMCIPNDKVEQYKEEAKKKAAEARAKKIADRKKKEKEEGRFQEPLSPQKPIGEAPEVGGTDPVVVKGNFLYNSKTGDRFFAKGVAYNPRNMVFDDQLMKTANCTPGDPIQEKLDYAADPTAVELESTWKEALNAIALLGANTVRLYNVDPEISHKPFMDHAASLGLYVIVPLTRHDWGFLPAGSPSPLCYTEEIEGYGNVGTNVLISAKLIVQEFSQYDNTLLFTVANEMTVSDPNGYAAFPCVKALTRDIHRFQANCSETMRRVPLIYADMDMGVPYRELVGRYLACEVESPDDAIDAYGINVYSWCDTEYKDKTGKDNFEYSPYYPISTEFKSFSKPLLFTEFGCTIGEFAFHCPYKGGRTWPDVKTFFNQFKEILSGAVAFEFSMEDNEYGLVLTPNFTSDKNNQDFYYLESYYALQKEFKNYTVSKEWNGAEIDDCSWTPSEAHKMADKHNTMACPKLSEVKALFKEKKLKAKPNWDSLPPTPDGADVDELASCPEYKVSELLVKEGCCHFDCDTKK